MKKTLKPFGILLIFLSTLLFVSADAIKNDTELILSIKGVPSEDANNFDGLYSVYKNGYINLPLIGNVKASGKTPSGLAKHIEGIYKKEELYTNPTINVKYDVDNKVDSLTFTFRAQAGQRIVPYSRDMTLQEAIAAAGGPGTFDSKKFVILERAKKEYKFDMRKVEDRNEKIYPKDVLKLPHVNKDGIFNIF